MTPPSVCPDCGQPHITRHGHQACTGHAKHTARPENRAPNGGLVPCKRPPLAGLTVCRSHGGRAPRARAAAARRVAEQEAEKALERGLAAAYRDGVPDVDPAEAMLSAVRWKYAEVVALRERVADLDDHDRVWGVTKIKTGGDDSGTTREAKPNIWWQMLRTAEAQLVQFAKDARAAGCDEQRVRIAQETGNQFVALMTRVLDALYAALIAAGVPADVLLAAWQAAVAEVVPREIRAFEGRA